MNSRDKCEAISNVLRAWKYVMRMLLLFTFVCASIMSSIDGTVHALGVSPQAVTVYGQGGSFTSSTANNGGISNTSLSNPRRLVTDSTGGVYVSDFSNNRILYFPLGSTTATRVYGQGGSFASSTANNGGVTANSLNQPRGVDLDNSDDLYIVDTGNNRVLYYPVGTTTATRVYGQGGSFTASTANNGGVTANSLNQPIGVGVDDNNNVYITDSSNNRVLYYAGTSTTATRVYGQGGSFTTSAASVTSTGLSVPTDVVVDHNLNVYIADKSNNRVLYYAGTSTTATRVYGQGGSFTASTANNGGTSATSLSAPYGVQVDNYNDLYIVDTSNNRVLYYPVGTTTAVRVYGQGGSFTTATSGTTATTLNTPVGMEFDTSGDLYIADNGNNRMLEFETVLSVSTQPSASTPVNTPFAISVNLVDVGSGSVYTDFTGSVSVAIKAGSGTTGAVLSGTIPISAVSGAATFSNLAIDTAGTGYILTVSSSGVGSGNTNSFIIAGPLLFTPLTSPTFSFTLTGATGTITSQHTFKVNDTTYSGVGWHVTITSTQLTTGSKTLSTTATTITSVSAACTPTKSCVLPTNSYSYPLTVPAASTAPTAISFFNATGGTGTGDITMTVTFSLSVSPGTTSGTYTSTYTETLVKGQ